MSVLVARALRHFLLMAGLLACALWPLHAADRVHTVRKGETLSGLARKYGVTVADLAERNGLKKTEWVYVGQKLRIPSEDGGSTTPPPVPAGVARAIESASVRPGQWKRIVIHHSGTREGSAKGMHEYHLKHRHMEHGLAYHFVIGNGRGMGDGEIHAGNRWKEQLHGGHLASEAQNKVSLGICLVGNFDERAPTARQMKNLTALVTALQKRCGIEDDAVTTHQKINVVSTRCPGKHFPLVALQKELRTLDP